MKPLEWNFNMDEAPRGEWKTKRVKLKSGKFKQVPVYVGKLIIVAGKTLGHVTTSRWLEEDQRWEMFTKNEQPLAWMSWPTHPEVA